MDSWRALVAAIAFACTACTDQPGESPLGFEVDRAAWRAHVEFLAHDLLQGREAGTRGYDIAARYVASQFAAVGLAPGGPDGRYLQPVPMRAARLVPDSAVMRVHGPSGEVSLAYGEQFLTFPSVTYTDSRVTAPVVYVGHGIHSETFGIDDFVGLDLEGKVAAFVPGFPDTIPSEEGAALSSGRAVRRAVVARGAVGLLGVYDETLERIFPFAAMRQALAGNAQMAWLAPGGEPFAPGAGLKGGAVLAPEATPILFEGAARSYEAIREQPIGDAPRRGMPLAVEVTLEKRIHHEEVLSHNVVGLLEGSDPDLADEYVLLSAHLDGLGTGEPVEGDAVYNGAMDNASGIAALLETARILAEAEPGPRRSVLFLATAAEEKGSVGAEYFAHHPPVPIEQVVADVNLDMPVLTYDFTDVVAFGASHSTLSEPVGAAAEEMGIARTPDPDPARRMFVRSDHYRFVEQGVPAIMLATGPGNGGEAARTAFLDAHYHQPSDELERVDPEAGARFAELNARIAWKVASADRRPAWRDGDFFGARFGRGNERDGAGP